MSSFKIGQTIETTTHQQGLVKYLGPIHVAEGTWLGIELPSPDGKNDGSVRGERYFTCPPAHGLFVRDTSILRIVSQPPVKAAAPKPVAKAPVASTSTRAPAPKPRPSSVIAPKPNPRLSTITKRQSVAPTSTQNPLRAPIRKASIAGTSSTSATATSTTASTSKSLRDSNVETLQTKIRHLEKQHADDQDRLKELSQARDERDRFESIIQKLQVKCQTLHQQQGETKTLLQQAQAENDQLVRASQESEIDLEDALVDKEMAEERAEQAESELEMLRTKLEERDMELEILREEAELFTAEMSSEEREEAGYYRLQHENDRLRQALITLKEMTGEQEDDLKARIREVEADNSALENTRQHASELQEQLSTSNSITEHLRSQLEANAEWEDISNELTTRCHELEDKVVSQEAIIQDLESLRELNDELEIQHVEQEQEMRAELEAKDAELAEQNRRLESQDAVIVNDQDLIDKFRELVFELQGRIADAESSRNMTAEQVKDTTGRFNEVMDLNRRLRATNVQATTKEITSKLHELQAAEASEQLSILTETESREFLNSESLRTYFTAKRIAAKSSLVSGLLSATDRQLSYSGGIDEALSRLQCVEAVKHLTIVESGSDRLRSAIKASSLAQFAEFGPTYPELVTVEKSLDHSLDTLREDTVNFAELANALQRSCKTHEAVLSMHQDALLALPEDVVLARIQNITANLTYLDANFGVVNAMLNVMDTAGAQDVLERFVPSSLLCNKAMLSAQSLLRSTAALHKDHLYPKFLGGAEEVTTLEEHMNKLAREAAEWGQKALKIVSTSIDADGATGEVESELIKLLQFYWSSDITHLGAASMQLDYWHDDVSVLMNSIEIEHGPTPWSQKAKLMEVARQKNSEASVFLENLKAEHKATLLSLHERERVIETKSLEIEHLEAKYRDATNKVGDNQQLLDKIKDAEAEVAKLSKLVKSQQLEIASLEAQASRAEQVGQVPVASDAVDPAKEPLDWPERIPAHVDCMLHALQEENHWLRRRENTALFDRSVREMAVLMNVSKTAERFLAGQMSVEEYYEYSPLDLDLDSDDDDEPNVLVKSSKHSGAKETQRAPEATVARPKMSHLALDSVQTGWQPRADSTAGVWEAVETSLDWDILSTIAEDYEGDTMDLEGFSEIDTMSDL